MSLECHNVQTHYFNPVFKIHICLMEKRGLAGKVGIFNANMLIPDYYRDQALGMTFSLMQKC